MFEIQTLSHNMPAAMRQADKHARECFTGEPITLGHPFPVASIEQTGGPDVEAADGDSSVLVLHDPGRYSFAFTYASGQVGQLRLVACDRSVLDAIPDRESTTGALSNFESKALVLRSLANNCDKFDGTTESLIGVSLRLFGA